MNKIWTKMREITAVTKLLFLVALAGIILTFGTLSWLEQEFPLPSDFALRVKYLEQYISLLQVIVVGFVVALVSVIIPMTLPEARDRFERFKESREAYSRAKTAVIYLPDRVASLDREKAFRLVEKTHRELHLAETFQDLIIGKNYLKWFANPELWVSYNYLQILAVAKTLHEFDWGKTEKRSRLKSQLEYTLDAVHERFGESGENLLGVKYDPKKGSPWRKIEDNLKKEIRGRIRHGPEQAKSLKLEKDGRVVH